jgi:cell division initiation protein
LKDLITALDIENKSFAKVLRGYDPLEVDEFLDSVAECLHDWAGRCKRLEQEKQLLEEQLKEYGELKDSLQEALLMAQKSANDKIGAAKQQGEAIIAEAKAKSEKILFNASVEKDHCMSDVKDLKKLKRELNAEIRTVIAKFSTLIETEGEPEEMSDSTVLSSGENS